MVDILHIQRLDGELELPARAHYGDAGLDLHLRDDTTLNSGQRQLVRTGIAIAVPYGHVGLIHPRSGLAHKHGLSIVNAPGTIDSGYRGEVMVNLINLGEGIVTLCRGDRIAQLIIQRVEMLIPVEIADIRDVDLPYSNRGDRGHGSSGQ